jgi:hypothetical protein
MAVFGKFAGGELCFPRLGVVIDARERDMLVCDCPQELHGTLTMSQGNRYSVVLYTREGLTTKGFKLASESWDVIPSESQPRFAFVITN